MCFKELGAALVVEEPRGEGLLGVAVRPERASFRTASLGDDGGRGGQVGLVGVQGTNEVASGLDAG